MNILYTAAGRFENSLIERNIAAWMAKHHIVEFIPAHRLSSYLRSSGALALIDAIVCSADGNLIHVSSSGEPEFNNAFEHALNLSWDVHALPENCAMRDGRKWRSLPFIIFRSVHENASYAQQYTHARIEFAPRGHPKLMLLLTERIVVGYQQQILDDYKTCGILVNFENGRARIRPALRKKGLYEESEYYYASGDRRRFNGWVTFSRDQQGLRYEVELFRQLLDRNATETEMHKFFENHPSFLMDARLGVPISHSPVFTKPEKWTPDFSVTSILGSGSNELELLELKGPGEKFLKSGAHGGFSAKVKAAVDQVRDYDRCLREPANRNAVLEALGYLPKSPRLAVLIGRAPTDNAGREVREKRQSEIDVQVISYDEILCTQVDQLRP